MYKLVDLVIILSALVGRRMCHLVDFQIKSSSSPSTVKMVLKWEVAMGGWTFSLINFYHSAFTHLDFDSMHARSLT